jgi:hypothetical protein
MNKTQPTKASAKTFLAAIKDEARRKDAQTVMAMMERVSGHAPQMWGTSIVGFGSYAYKYESGREGEWLVTGLSPRKDSLTVYILPGLHLQKHNLKNLGKITTGKSCIYIKKLDDVDMPTLEKIVKQAYSDIGDAIVSAKKKGTKTQRGKGK